MSGYIPPRRKRKANNFKFAMGMGVNWIDLDTGYIYMIQNYKEQLDDPKIPPEKKPKKIQIMASDGITEIGWAEPEIVEERMKDPMPDPKYADDPPKKGKW